MHVRHTYLKIETVENYSPVAPDDAEHHRYRLDCMRNHGHEDGRIPQSEVDRRALDALVYREYTDADFTHLKSDPLISADINEPRVERRVPGTVIYTEPGERLYIHVLNGDTEPHSFHPHGLHYGIDSDGSWPFGVGQDDGNRSDAICPGKIWCYVLDAKKDSVGAWPFHDHHMHIEAAVNRGLFGGIVVRDPHAKKADLEAPIFLHRMAGEVRAELFDSGSLGPGDVFSFSFSDEGTFEYYCRFHPMQGRVRVTTTGPLAATVNILDAPGRFDPDDVTIRVGGTVTWTHAGSQPHTVTDRTGAGLASYAINGRTFVGNTPTLVAKSGTRIRWYVFNLDLGALWHNFHLHGQRWSWGAEWIDTRSLGPAESFVVDSVVPPVILSPVPDECYCEPETRDVPPPGKGHHGGPSHAPAANPGRVAHPESGKETPPEPPSKKRNKYRLQGDFLIHCHAEEHMMHGMAGLVRALQEVELTSEEIERLCYHLPQVRVEHCPELPHPCTGDGRDGWEVLNASPIFIVHGALMRSGRVLVFSGAAESGYPLEARLWNPSTTALTPSVIPLPEDFFCSGHTFLSDGRLLVMGGDTPTGHTNNRSYIFSQNPAALDTGAFVATGNMAHPRWYPTAVRLSDGRVLALSGGHPVANEVEAFDGATWTVVTGATRSFGELYPGLHLLPSGEIFYTRAGWANASGTQTAYLTMTGPTTGIWSDYAQQQFYDRQEGMSLLTIDTTVSPVQFSLYVFGGGVSGPATARNNATAEVMEFAGGIAGASWRRLSDMNFGRTNVNAVILPTGKILIVGGHSNGQKWSPTPILPTEIYDPASDSWTVGAPLSFPRQYHSVCILLPDGRVFAAGGVAPGTADPDQHSLELYSPNYLSLGVRPVISAAPTSVTYGNAFSLDTSQAAGITSVVLIAPISVTHHTDSGQRYIKLPILSRTATNIETRAPANGNIAPPGDYMLFVVNAQDVPSEARFVNIG